MSVVALFIFCRNNFSFNKKYKTQIKKTTPAAIKEERFSNKTIYTHLRTSYYIVLREIARYTNRGAHRKKKRYKIFIGRICIVFFCLGNYKWMPGEEEFVCFFLKEALEDKSPLLSFKQWLNHELIVQNTLFFRSLFLIMQYWAEIST